VTRRSPPHRHASVWPPDDTVDGKPPSEFTQSRNDRGAKPIFDANWYWSPTMKLARLSSSNSVDQQSRPFMAAEASPAKKTNTPVDTHERGGSRASLPYGVIVAGTLGGAVMGKVMIGTLVATVAGGAAVGLVMLCVLAATA
jgi:hypothetical protein